MEFHTLMEQKFVLTSFNFSTTVVMSLKAYVNDTV